jgi:hypothetical protein
VSAPLAVCDCVIQRETSPKPVAFDASSVAPGRVNHMPVWQSDAFTCQLPPSTGRRASAAITPYAARYAVV